MDLLFVSVVGMCFASSKYLLIFKWHFIYNFAMNFFSGLFATFLLLCGMDFGKTENNKKKLNPKSRIKYIWRSERTRESVWKISPAQWGYIAGRQRSRKDWTAHES